VAMIMSVVMMVIGNSLARAFGLAGAMSIIRFRTVVKDTRDTAYVFFALGAGMAAGSGNLKIALIGTLLVGFFIGILHWTRHGTSSRNEFLLSFDMVPTDREEERKIFFPVFERFLKAHHLVNVKSVRMGQFLNLTYQVSLKDPSQTDALVAELSALEGLNRVAMAFGDEAEG
jgi:uncharacterized membrane protein YhiD involved in acid resistance